MVGEEEKKENNTELDILRPEEASCCPLQRKVWCGVGGRWWWCVWGTKKWKGGGAGTAVRAEA
jgi:hypothetical protein